jgi:hypothetical protein
MCPASPAGTSVAKAVVCLCRPQNMNRKLSACTLSEHQCCLRVTAAWAGGQQGLANKLNSCSGLDLLVLATFCRSSQGGSTDEEHNRDRPAGAGESWPAAAAVDTVALLVAHQQAQQRTAPTANQLL